MKIIWWGHKAALNCFLGVGMNGRVRGVGKAVGRVGYYLINVS